MVISGDAIHGCFFGMEQQSQRTTELPMSAVLVDVLRGFLPKVLQIMGNIVCGVEPDGPIMSRSFRLIGGDGMAWWNIFGGTSVSDCGEVIQQMSDTTSVSSTGTTYTRMGPTTIGSDGSTFTQMGIFSTDGSTRIGSGATGLGAVFNKAGNGFDDDSSNW